MRFGMVTYQSAYNSKSGKVCITTDMEPSPIHCYSRAEILELIETTPHDGLKAIYEAALAKFPEVTNEQSHNPTHRYISRRTCGMAGRHGSAGNRPY